MKILVYPHSMEIGGSPLNAIESAAHVEQAGHEVLVFVPDGPLLSRVRELGLEYHRAPVTGTSPSLRNMNRLIELVRTRAIDVVHGYERMPVLELAYGPHLLLGTPMVATTMDMTVKKFLPRHVPLTVGTQELVETARARHAEVHLMEPPIDTDLNAPSSDPRSARQQFGVADDELLLSIVCRITTHLEKVHGVLEAIAAVDELAERFPVRLLVVGDGADLPRVRAAAAPVNDRTGRETVIVTGELLDPRPAYDAADVVLGMGSSALKGLAFAKPLVVQGPSGFWVLLTPESAPLFLDVGFVGNRPGGGTPALVDILRQVLPDASARQELGDYGRRLVVERFSLPPAAALEQRLYSRALSSRSTVVTRTRHLAGPAAGAATYKTGKAVLNHVVPEPYRDRLRTRFAPLWDLPPASDPARPAGSWTTPQATSYAEESTGEPGTVASGPGAERAGSSDRIGHTIGP
ncbi:glycosyltransferase [Modestobacter marinus]|uniref:glycosyltransferase n=1 Tax=Modestobacter marinus TaxID=477641 RepID=UPI001C9616C4|nr:glycosyltransferase [Modestobacter marinus]